jgi:transcriptional regulator with PAS, ATPase and Fis domain
MNLLPRIARSHGNVLLQGESGSGKSFVARQIHDMSPRKEGPFVALSCANLPANLIESELFGHEKGAFSGAERTRSGKIETARGGTLFLDEIAELPLRLQPKLLSFLQERSFYRLGGDHLIESDVRLITATNRDLRQMMKAGKFREDLFFRIYVLHLEIAPLRERMEEIAPLALNLLKRILEREGVEGPAGFTPAAIDAILHYDWPGNVRELENVMERTAALADPQSPIDLEHLPPELHPGLTHEGFTLDYELQSTGNLANRKLAELELEAIRQTLLANKGSRSLSARALGISEKTLYNKIRRHHIPTDP